MTRRHCALYPTGIICGLLLIVGIALMVGKVFQTVIQNRLKKEITLTESSRVFESWKNPPPPVYMQYFFFNVTNPDAILKGEKAVLTQIGPYTYREYRSRENVTFIEKGKVSAFSPKTFVFERDMSVGDPAVDVVMTVNIPVVAVMNKVTGFLQKSAVSIYMSTKGIGLFTNLTIDQLLWGYQDPLLTYVKTRKPEIEEFFGLMYKKNGSFDDQFVFLTGEGNHMDYTQVEQWNGMSQLSWWTSNSSNMINGTDGSSFHPLLSKDERPYIFSPDLCRSIHVAYQKDVKVKGIQAYRFTPPRDVLASPEENPANAGFCTPRGECLGTGVLKVSVCRKDTPIIVSFPHFYLADEKYVTAVEGLSPNREDHQTFLDLNPTTGIPVRASKRAQINILLKKISGFVMTRNLQETVFPIMFINESMVIDDGSAAKMKKLLLIESLVTNFPLIFIALGAILLVVFLILLWRFWQQKTTTKAKTIYSPVSARQEELSDGNLTPASKNGAYISMSPMESEKS